MNAPFYRGVYAKNVVWYHQYAEVILNELPFVRMNLSFNFQQMRENSIYTTMFTLQNILFSFNSFFSPRSYHLLTPAQYKWSQTQLYSPPYAFKFPTQRELKFQFLWLSCPFVGILTFASTFSSYTTEVVFSLHKLCKQTTDSNIYRWDSSFSLSIFVF